MLYGLADCNNFYASCERLFHPELRNRPVVVLSNNDGCIVARSNESKALGLKMGTPLYQARDIIEKHDVAVFSSNYVLYGDISRRVMSLLSSFTPHLDVYSVDEAFLDLSGMGGYDALRNYGQRIVRTIGKGVGIPVSLGIAPTKTLAKMASKFAKKYKGYEGVCIIDTDEKREKALILFDVGDVWGVGRQSLEKLKYHSVHSAWDLSQKTESWVKRNFNVVMVRTWKELNGIDCIDIAELPQKKSICTSRSFADQGISDKGKLEEAVANFASECGRKLREQNSCCQSITVFAYTSRFKTNEPGDVIHETVHLPVPTRDSSEIISVVLDALRKKYKRYNYQYKKAGVILWNICSDEGVQGNLFDTVNRSKQKLLTDIIDQINHKNGHNMVRRAVQGNKKRFELKNEYISKQYTTNIREVMVIKS